jgi:hypothetical protein
VAERGARLRDRDAPAELAAQYRAAKARAADVARPALRARAAAAAR